MGDIFGDYAVREAWDEMFASPDEPRTPDVPLYEKLRALTQADFDDRCEAVLEADHVRHEGIDRPPQHPSHRTGGDGEGSRRCRRRLHHRLRRAPLSSFSVWAEEAPTS